MSRHYDTTVVGGGFYGCMLAVDRARSGERVLLLEQGHDLLGGPLTPTRRGFIRGITIHAAS